MRSALLWIPLALVGGCTAAKAQLQIVNAEQALTRATTQGAPDRATYEFTMARLYLDKAQEEAGYSEFRIADALARQSAEWSDRAVIFMEERGKGEFELDDLSDVVSEPFVPEIPPDAPPPTGPTDDWLEESNPDTVPTPPDPTQEPSPEPAPAPPDEFEIEEEDDDIQVDPK